jgi:hypothetical protein
MYPYERRYNYPHMSPADTTIWEKFIDTFPTRYSTVDYDVALGSTPLTAEQITSQADANMVRLWQKRIDVLAKQGDETHIIEVKPKAGPSAIGQVLSYCELYKGYIDPFAKVKAIIITDSATPDIALLASQMQVEVIIV